MSDELDHTKNLKISKESGVSGVAAVTPKVLPVGSATYRLSVNYLHLYRPRRAYLVRLEAKLIINSYLEVRARLPDPQDGWATEITVGIVTVAECQTVNIAVRLVVGCAIIQKSPDTSTLDDD